MSVCVCTYSNISVNMCRMQAANTLAKFIDMFENLLVWLVQDYHEFKKLNIYLNS